MGIEIAAIDRTINDRGRIHFHGCCHARSTMAQTLRVRIIFGGAKNDRFFFGDNQSAIAKAKNRNYHARTKHIDVRKWFIQDILHHDGAKDDMQRIIKL